VLLPDFSATRRSIVISVTLVDSSVLLTGSSQSTHLSVFMDWVCDPVDTGITTDSLVLRIDEDDFEVFVGGILVDPVRVQDSEIGATTTDTFFGGGTKRSLRFELVYSLVGWFTFYDISISSKRKNQ